MKLPLASLLLLAAAAASATESTRPATPPVPGAQRPGEGRPQLVTKPGCDKDPAFKQGAQQLPEDTAVILDVTVKPDGSVGPVTIVAVSPDSPEGKAMAEKLRACWPAAKYNAGGKEVHVRPRIMLKKERAAAGAPPAASAAPKK